MREFCHTAGKTAENLVAIMMVAIVVMLIASCSDGFNRNPPEPPPAENNSIVGTWEVVEAIFDDPSAISTKYRYTFYEDGTYGNVMIFPGDDHYYGSTIYECYTWQPVRPEWQIKACWRVSGDTIFFPDCFDYRTRHSVDYLTRFSADGGELWVKEINYPYVCFGCGSIPCECVYTMEGFAPWFTGASYNEEDHSNHMIWDPKCSCYRDTVDHRNDVDTMFRHKFTRVK